MSRISELLEKVISKVNDSVKRTPQNFSEQDKKQIRDNIGIVKGDFNQNDVDAADYIRNKPFHTVEVAGWEEIANNITNDSENIIVSKPIDLDNLNLRILTSAGEEDIITKDSKTLIVKIRDDGSYVLQYSSGIMPGSAVYEFRLNGNVDGSGNTVIPYVDMVSTDATLTVYQWSVIDKQYINEDAIPQEIARVKDLPEVNYPVTSVNGQTGDVVLSEGVKSWNDLEDKPFGEGYKLICSRVDDRIGYVSTEVFKSGKNYIVLWNGVEYVGKTIDPNGKDHYDTSYSELFLYDKQGNYVTGNICCYCDEVFDIITCAPYFGDYENDTIYVYDPTQTEVKTIDEKYIPDSIARKSDVKVLSVNGKDGQVSLSYDDLENKPFGEDKVVTYVSAPFVEGSGVYIDVVLEDGEYTLVVESESPFQYNDTNTFPFIVQNGFAQLDHIGPGNSGDELLWYRDGQIYHTLGECGYTGSITIYGIEKSQLDEKFIPDTIARVEEVSDSILTTDEWNTLKEMLNNESEETTE